MFREDWYAAAEALLECVAANPAHAAGTLALAECYYELGEYGEALAWVKKARVLARDNLDAANLEGSILAAQGRLDEAAEVVAATLKREPYNREALFVAAELDIARGRPSDAVTRYREAARRFPDDRRLLVSLALVLGALGDEAAARAAIERAQALHGDDYRVFYYAAYLGARAGRLDAAVRDAERSLELRPGFAAARELLAGLRYRQGDAAGALALADEALRAAPRGAAPNAKMLLLKGMALRDLGDNAGARSAFEAALSGPGTGDEFVRAALEDLLLETTDMEDASRLRWSDWHVSRARDFRARNLYEQAIFEYRRALRLYPYHSARKEYADLLKLQGYRERYLDELRFLRGLESTSGNAGQEQAIDDAIESLDAEMRGSLLRRNGVQPEELQPHWTLAVFALAGQVSLYHTGAAPIAAAYLKDLLSQERNIRTTGLGLRQPSFAAAFRSAREAAGRLCVALAERADTVVRVVCGIPTALKGEITWKSFY